MATSNHHAPPTELHRDNSPTPQQEATTQESAEAAAVLTDSGASTSSRPPTIMTSIPSALHPSPRERKKKGRYTIKKLEKKLEILDRQIRKYNEAEVSLEDMNTGTSAYLKEDLLKRKFVKTWQKLCELQGIRDEIVIEDPEGANYTGTPYPEINRRVLRVLRLDEFPDYFDMCQLVERCNTKHNLGISSDERVQLSKKVFKDVGKKLKKRRQADFKAHFGSHLTDQAQEDPALQDVELLEQLKESVKKGHEALEKICESFVTVQESKYANVEKSPSGDSCSENEDEEEGIVEGQAEAEEGMEVEDMSLDLHIGSPFSESTTTSPDLLVEGAMLEEDPFPALDEGNEAVADSTLPSDSGEAAVSSTAPTSSFLSLREELEDSESPEESPSSNIMVDGLGALRKETSVTGVTSSSAVVVLDSSEDDDIVIID